MRNRIKGFTLLEIMIIIGIIGIILAIAAPTWLRQREISRARSCQENLSKIDQAMEQLAIEFKLTTGSPISYPSDLLEPNGAAGGTNSGYLKKEPKCPASGEYQIAVVGEDPICTIGSSSTPFDAHVLQ